MNKKNIIYIVTVVILVFITLTAFINTKQASGSTNNLEYKTIVVQNGDTLWNIVKNNCGNYKDIRKAIYDIEKLNKISSANILPGQGIKIPVGLYK